MLEGSSELKLVYISQVLVARLAVFVLLNNFMNILVN